MVSAEHIAKKISMMDYPDGNVLIEIGGDLYSSDAVWLDEDGDLVIRVETA